jgi:hypothetical protein
MAGPYRYKVVWLKEWFFARGDKMTANIQKAIDWHVQDGWELFECHPMPTAYTWQMTFLVFRRPAGEFARAADQEEVME